jgi:hypothetical protein
MPKQNDLPESEVDRLLAKLDLTWTKNFAKVTGWTLSDEEPTG